MSTEWSEESTLSLSRCAPQFVLVAANGARAARAVIQALATLRQLDAQSISEQDRRDSAANRREHAPKGLSNESCDDSVEHSPVVSTVIAALSQQPYVCSRIRARQRLRTRAQSFANGLRFGCRYNTAPLDIAELKPGDKLKVLANNSGPQWVWVEVTRKGAAKLATVHATERRHHSSPPSQTKNSSPRCRARRSSW